MNLDDAIHQLALARVNSRHVDGDRPGLDPELPLPPNERGDLGGINDILARQAGNVRARSADILPIYHGGSPSFFGHRPGCQFAGGAAAQHEGIEVFRCIHKFHLLQVAALSSEELLDEGRRVIWILFREKVSAVHRLSVRMRSPLPPDSRGPRPFRRKSQAGHPGPTEATLGIRFACRLPYRRYRVRRRSLFLQHQHGRESTAKLEPWAQASRGRYVVDLIVAVDPAITPSEAGMRGPTVRN